MTHYAADVSAVPASPSPQRWLLPLIVVVVCLMVGGGLLARELYREPDAVPAATLAPATSSASAPPGGQPGSDTVELTPDAAGHPDNAAVRKTLQGYFDAINNRDFSTWSKVVTRERFAQKSQSAWLNDFKSSKDGSVLVYRIEAVGGGNLRVLVGFTSVQDSGDAPAELPGASCVRWKLALPMKMQSGSWRVDEISGYAPPELAKC